MTGSVHYDDPVAATPSRRTVRARVIPTKERTGLGWLVGTLGGAGLLYVIFGLSWSHDGQRLLFGLGLATWALGAALAYRPRVRVVDVTDAADALHAGAVKVPRGAPARIADGVRGVSVAMGCGKGDVAFFEVDSAEDAAALVAMAAAVVGEPVVYRMGFDRFRGTARLLGLIGAAAGLAYGVTVGLLSYSEYKTMFGLTALFAASVATLFYLIAEFAWRDVVIGAPGPSTGVTGAIGRHLVLHRRDEESRAEAGKKRVDVAAGARTFTGVEGRVRVMARGDETVRAWLARVDVAGAQDEGYRSDAPTREELHALLGDATAATDLRLAAARVLVRRYRESPESVCAGIERDLVPYVRSITGEELEPAAEALDSLGPAFRAR